MAVRWWLVVALAVLWLWLVWRWWSSRGSSPARRFPVVTLVALAVLTGFEVHWQWRERQVDRAVESIAGASATTRCQRFLEAYVFAGAEAGHVEADPSGRMGSEAMLTWETCQDLFAWMRSDKDNPPLEHVMAVHVLTHEAVHLSGEVDEARTECLAMQWDAAVARRLGATEEQADALAADYWTRVYPRMSQAYRSAECAPGHAMDLQPGAPGKWPNGRIAG